MNIKKDTIMTVCPNARRCGGCQDKNMIYAASLRAKQGRLVRLLSRYGHVDKIIGMAEPTHYRNKVQAAFGKRDGKVISGIYQSSDGRIIPSELCMLEDVGADAIIVTIRNMCASFKLKPYDLRTGKGYLRHVLVRVGAESGEYMVVLVTAQGEFPSERSFVNELLRRHPEITTVVHNINATDTALFLGSESRVLFGDGYIKDKLCGLEFRISPKSFYQINHSQTQVLYGKAKEFASLTGGERVIDAYCGTGTIGLFMADKAKELIGVEVNADAVSDAVENAKRNAIGHARFVCADAGRFMSEYADAGESCDVVITDPPRAGCSKEFLRSLLKLAPKRIVYISCNPETLARDLYTLTKNGYAAEKIQGVDMFPFTEHVECVVCLTRQTKRRDITPYGA